MNGIITRLDVSQGQRVQENSTAMLIAAEQRLIARLGVEPEDLADVEAGTPVTITPVFVPDITIAATIREVHAMIDPATHLVEVLAPIPETQIAHLVLGSRILGRIQLAKRRALVVPRSAVLWDKDQAYLYIVTAGKARRVSVDTGVNDGDLIEVTGALKVGDAVVVSGNYEASDGMAVRETP
jgi:RND family efflux transporter MFP subunit